jgi:thiol:disulfide interchange protein
MAVVELNKDNFKRTIEQNAFVIVDFWAPWCDPCLTFTETFKQVAENHPDIVFASRQACLLRWESLAPRLWKRSSSGRAPMT